MHIFLTGKNPDLQYDILSKLVAEAPDLPVMDLRLQTSRKHSLSSLANKLDTSVPFVGLLSPTLDPFSRMVMRHPRVLFLEVKSNNPERVLSTSKEILLSTDRHLPLTGNSCGAVVVRQREKRWETLLIKSRAGNWSFPKGRMDPGETEAMTATREIREETGLITTIDPGFRKEVPSMPVARPGMNNQRKVVFFLATAIAGEETPQLSEIREMRWFSLNQKTVDAIDYAPDRSVLQQVLQSL